MSEKSGIAWTEATWNPLVGCSRVSEGCRHCYAETLTYRLGERFGMAKYTGLTRLVGGEPQWTGALRLSEPDLSLPLRWKKPRRVFVNSMSDLFHEKVPIDWLARIFNVMADMCADAHTFLVLTKRAARMRTVLSEALPEYAGEHYSGETPLGVCLDVGASAWPLPNVWLGVSVEDQATADERIPMLLSTPAVVRWVSYEPALGPVDFRRYLLPMRYAEVIERMHGTYLDWIVVGGESGPRARLFDLAWARRALTQCRAAGVPCFVKQLGSNAGLEVAGLEPPASGGRVRKWLRWRAMDRKGADITEWPPDLRVREYPADGTH